MPPSPPFAPSRRTVQKVYAWIHASKDMLKAVQGEGIIVNRSDDAAADTLPRSQVLASCAVEMTRCMLVYVALVNGHDVVEVDQELRRREAEVQNDAF